MYGAFLVDTRVSSAYTRSMKTDTVGRPISPERLALAKECLDDGWPYVEITRTHGISGPTLRKYFPGRGWSVKQGARLGYRIMKAGTK